MDVVRAVLQGGMYDGKMISLPADVDDYWVGDVKAAWGSEATLTEGASVGQDVLHYKLQDVRDDGVRVFVLASGMTGRAPGHA